jgi:coenzyme PQQ synthesis protein D (PqqD)
MEDTSYRRSAQLLEAGIGDELVALEPEKGNCFGFNEVATWVWRRLAEPATFEQLRDGLMTDFEVSGEQCATELQALLDDLISKGLISKAP